MGLGRPDSDEQLSQASDALTTAVTEPQFGAVEEAAQDALSRAPLSASAVSLMGLAEAQQGRRDRARMLMGAANALSHRDSASDLWLFEDALQAHRYAEAFRHGDALLRRDQGANLPVMFAMISAANDPAAIEPLARRLVTNPGWRFSFFYNAIRPPLPTYIDTLFQAMRKAGSPPTEDEMERFLNQLAATGDYEHAYLYWALTLSPAELSDLGYIYDGDFEGRNTLTPFGWKLLSNDAGAARISAAPGGGQALEVESDGYAKGTVASQLMVLPPGAYRLVGRTQTTSEDAADVLRWTVSCANGPTLAEAPAGPPGPQWRRFEVAFVVPAEGCTGQWLNLKAESSTRHDGVTVWYDNLNAVPSREAQP